MMLMDQLRRLILNGSQAIDGENSSNNGIDITCEQRLKNENTNLLFHVAKEKQGNGTALDFGSNQLHNKLSKSVNDVGNLGGRKRSKKSSFGDNFEDLSKYPRRNLIVRHAKIKKIYLI